MTTKHCFLLAIQVVYNAIIVSANNSESRPLTALLDGFNDGWKQ